MAITIGNHASSGGNFGGGATNGIDTTSATLLVGGISS
jgi:hypothetical protein